MTNPLEEWKANMLRDRGLNHPDSRPLYAYRLETSEFTSLESLLKNKLSQYMKPHTFVKLEGNTPLANVSRRIAGFPALFVLYASEWWRQSYDGSGFSWDPILRDIGVPPDSWNPIQRSQCIEHGLTEWGLALSETRGMRYIGTIALQGGLPMKLLAQAKGPLGKLLRSVLKEAVKGSIVTTEIQGWVRSLDHYLPRTYRNPEIHALLTKVIETVLLLKERAGLTESSGAVEKLEELIPDWRGKFPLPVEDSDIQGLIEQLIRDASAVRVVKRFNLFCVDRIIEKDNNGNWKLRSSLSLPETIESRSLKEMFALDMVEKDFPRFFDLALEVGGEEHSTTLRRLAGEPKYRVERSLWSFSDKKAAEEHILRLSTSRGESWKAPAFMGEELSEDLPWVFDVRDESPKWVRQGSGNVSPQEAFIAVPNGWTPNAISGTLIIADGQILEFDRQVFRVKGEVRLSCEDAEYRIRTGRADSGEEHYEWRGDRLWTGVVRPSLVFLGSPSLYQVDDLGDRKALTGIGWRSWGEEWKMRETLPWGPVEARYPATGEVQFRSRILLLPSDARVVLVSNDATSGSICLEGWGAAKFLPLGSGERVVVQHEDQDLIIRVSGSGRTVVPEWVEGDLYWEHLPKPVRLRMPYPGQGARAFSASGQEILPDTLLTTDQLLGARVIFMCGNPDAVPHMRLEMRLKKRLEGVDIPIKPGEGLMRVEIRLPDHKSEIERLLSIDDGTDAQIEVTAVVGVQSIPLFGIARYSCLLERFEDYIVLEGRALESLTEEDLAEIPVLTLRLETPGDDPTSLKSLTSEGISTGFWSFDPASHEPGSWLIYPGIGSRLSFRPTIWMVPGETGAEESLAKTIGIEHASLREQKLDDEISLMVSDFLAPGWRMVNQYFTQFGHLPLATLDLWRCFSHSGEAMAALTMRLSTITWNFIDRFATELPFAWEIVSYSDWCQSIANLRHQCEIQYSESAQTIFNSYLDDKIKNITSHHPSLSYSLGFAKAWAKRETSQEIEMFRKYGDIGLSKFLFSGDQCSLQKLLRNPSEERWPDDFNNNIDKVRSTSPYAYLLSSDEYGYRDGVINLPILLAIQNATNNTREWFSSGRIREIRRYMIFDGDWFEDAFNWTMARCFVAGLLKSEKK